MAKYSERGGELHQCYDCGEALSGTYYEETVTKHDGSSRKVGKVLTRRKYCKNCYNKLYDNKSE